MRPRAVTALTIALLSAGLFTRLGLWQLDRLRERQAFNARAASHLTAPPVDVGALPPAPDRARMPGADEYRRVVARGVFDWRQGTAVTGRSSNGSPGVHLATPLLLADGRRVLVNRGWVYSPDARTVALPTWDEPGDTVRVEGYLTAVPASIAAAPAARGVIAYLVQTSDTSSRPDRPRRLGPPVLEERNHRSYAVQWFAFAAIALVGGGLLARRDWTVGGASA